MNIMRFIKCCYFAAIGVLLLARYIEAQEDRTATVEAAERGVTANDKVGEPTPVEASFTAVNGTGAEEEKKKAGDANQNIQAEQDQSATLKMLLEKVEGFDLKFAEQDELNKENKEALADCKSKAADAEDRVTLLEVKLESQAQEHEAKIGECNEDKKLLAEDLKAETAKVETCENAKKAMMHKSNETEAELAACTKKKEEKVASLRECLNAKYALNNEFKALQQKCAQAEDISHANEDNGLKDDNAAKNVGNDAADVVACTDDKNMLLKAQKDLAECSGLNESLNGDIIKLQDKNEGYVAELKACSQTNNKLDERISNMQNEAKDTACVNENNRLLKAQEDAEDCKKSGEVLKQEIVEVRKEKEETLTDLKACTVTKDGFKNDIKNLQHEKEDYVTKVEACSSDIKVLSEEKKDLDHEKKECMVQLTEVKAERDGLTRQIETKYKPMIENCKDEKDTVTLQKVSLEAKNLVLKQDYKNLASAARKSEAECLDEHNQKDNKIAALERQQVDQMAELARQKEQLSKELQELEESVLIKKPKWIKNVGNKFNDWKGRNSGAHKSGDQESSKKEKIKFGQRLKNVGSRIKIGAKDAMHNLIVDIAADIKDM